MRMVVFGPTGGTGREVVLRALAAGHEVTAFARRPQALAIRHQRLAVVEGDVLQRDAVADALADASMHAVVSALGVHHRGPTTVYSAGTAHIVAAMRTTGIRRLICLSSAGVTPNPAFSLIQSFLVDLIVDRLYPRIYADMRQMEALLRASDLDWTIVRAPGLTDGRRTGNYVSTVDRHVPRQRSLSRADVADYILTHLRDPETHRASVELAGPSRKREQRAPAGRVLVPPPLDTATGVASGRRLRRVR